MKCLGEATHEQPRESLEQQRALPGQKRATAGDQEQQQAPQEQQQAPPEQRATPLSLVHPQRGHPGPWSRRSHWPTQHQRQQQQRATRDALRPA